MPLSSKDSRNFHLIGDQASGTLEVTGSDPLNPVYPSPSHSVTYSNQLPAFFCLVTLPSFPLQRPRTSLPHLTHLPPFLSHLLLPLLFHHHRFNLTANPIPQIRFLPILLPSPCLSPVRTLAACPIAIPLCLQRLNSMAHKVLLP